MLFRNPLTSRVFSCGKRRASQSNFIFLVGFSDLSGAPSPLCDHGLLDLRINGKTTTTTTIDNSKVIFWERTPLFAPPCRPPTADALLLFLAVQKTNTTYVPPPKYVMPFNPPAPCQDFYSQNRAEISTSRLVLTRAHIYSTNQNSMWFINIQGIRVLFFFGGGGSNTVGPDYLIPVLNMTVPNNI